MGYNFQVTAPTEAAAAAAEVAFSVTPFANELLQQHRAQPTSATTTTATATNLNAISDRN